MLKFGIICRWKIKNCQSCKRWEIIRCLWENLESVKGKKMMNDIMGLIPISKKKTIMKYEFISNNFKFNLDIVNTNYFESQCLYCIWTFCQT